MDIKSKNWGDVRVRLSRLGDGRYILDVGNIVDGNQMRRYCHYIGGKRRVAEDSYLDVLKYEGTPYENLIAFLMPEGFEDYMSK